MLFYTVYSGFGKAHITFLPCDLLCFGSGRFLSLVRRVCRFCMSGVLLSFPVSEKPAEVGFTNPTKIGPLGFEAWRSARGFVPKVWRLTPTFLGLAALRRSKGLNAIFGA